MKPNYTEVSNLGRSAERLEHDKKYATTLWIQRERSDLAFAMRLRDSAQAKALTWARISVLPAIWTVVWFIIASSPGGYSCAFVGLGATLAAAVRWFMGHREVKELNAGIEKTQEGINECIRTHPREALRELIQEIEKCHCGRE